MVQIERERLETEWPNAYKKNKTKSYLRDRIKGKKTTKLKIFPSRIPEIIRNISKVISIFFTKEANKSFN